MAHNLYLPNLQRLHRSMTAAERSRCAFVYRHPPAEFHVLFLADVEPMELIFAQRGGRGFVFVKTVIGFRIDPYMSDDYQALREAVAIPNGRDHEFSTAKFFHQFGRRIPTDVGQTERAPWRTVLRAHPELENADRPYFVAWIPWPPGRKGVSAENLAKTRHLFGAVVEQRCRERNVSTRWSADPERYRDPETLAFPGA